MHALNIFNLFFNDNFPKVVRRQYACSLKENQLYMFTCTYVYNYMYICSDEVFF